MPSLERLRPLRQLGTSSPRARSSWSGWRVHHALELLLILKHVVIGCHGQKAFHHLLVLFLDRICLPQSGMHVQGLLGQLSLVESLHCGRVVRFWVLVQRLNLVQEGPVRTHDFMVPF